MSQHRSLRAAATLGGKRNVLKRFERLELLKKRGQWKEGDRITGLRKTKGEAYVSADRENRARPNLTVVAGFISIGNSKSEVRNPKQIQISETCNVQNTQANQFGFL